MLSSFLILLFGLENLYIFFKKFPNHCSGDSKGGPNIGVRSAAFSPIHSSRCSRSVYSDPIWLQTSQMATNCFTNIVNGRKTSPHYFSDLIFIPLFPTLHSRSHPCDALAFCFVPLLHAFLLGPVHMLHSVQPASRSYTWLTWNHHWGLSWKISFARYSSLALPPHATPPYPNPHPHLQAWILIIMIPSASLFKRPPLCSTGTSVCLAQSRYSNFYWMANVFFFPLNLCHSVVFSPGIPGLPLPLSLDYILVIAQQFTHLLYFYSLSSKLRNTGNDRKAEVEVSVHSLCTLKGFIAIVTLTELYLIILVWNKVFCSLKISSRFRTFWSGSILSPLAFNMRT